MQASASGLPSAGPNTGKDHSRMKRYTIAPILSNAGLAELVEAGEKHFEEQLENLSAELAALPELHLIGLTGPTCSGKTTAAEHLTRALARHGKALHVISIDDFYFNKSYLREQAQESGRQEPDFDSEETIDVDFLRECTESLLAGKPTRMPHFNFHSGCREEGELLCPRHNDLFLFEGIQILYPGVDAILSQSAYRSVYISPSSSIAAGGELFLPNEIRLMRRLVRDYRYRNATPAFTFYLWQSVRENEEKNIFPYVHHCSSRIDSTMPYEIGVLKPYLESILPQIPETDHFWGKGQSILARLDEVQAVPDSYIGPESLYKEFI